MRSNGIIVLAWLTVETVINKSFVYYSSVKLGCDMLELDCQLTKDEEVVVSHDNDLFRATGVNKCISDLTFNELPPYSDHLDVTFGFGESLVNFAPNSLCFFRNAF